MQPPQLATNFSAKSTEAEKKTMPQIYQPQKGKSNELKARNIAHVHAESKQRNTECGWYAQQ